MFAWIYKINNNKDVSNNSEDLRLVDFFSNPQNITIQKGFPANERVKLNRKDLIWYVTDKNEWPASEFNISKLLGRLRHFQVRNVLTIEKMKEEGENLSDYGLEEPNLKIDISSIFGKISLLFGNETRNDQQIYMMPIYENQKTKSIWAVNKSLKAAAYIPKEEWMKKEFFNIPVYNIESFSLTKKSEETLLKTKFTKGGPNTWQITAPIRANADTNAVHAFLTTLVSSRVKRFITDEVESSLINSALDNPLMKIKIEGQNKIIELKLGEIKESTNGGNLISAQIQGNHTTFSLDQEFLNFISNTENKLRDKRLFFINSDNVSTLEIIKENKKLSIHKLENGRWEVLSIDDSRKFKNRPGDDKIIKDYIQKLNTFQATSFVNDTPSFDDLKKYGLNPPKQLLNIDSSDGDSYSLLIGEYSKKFNGYYAKSNNTTSVYTCSRTLQMMMNFEPRKFRLRSLEAIPESSTVNSIKIIKYDHDSSILNLDINSTRSLHNLIRNFEANKILEENFSKDGTNINGQFLTWEYMLTAKISQTTIGTISEREIIYFFTREPSNYKLIGGSPKSNVIFTIPDKHNKIMSYILDKDSNRSR